MWELRGCPYCRETHLVNFAKPEIEDFVRRDSISCSSTSSARARSRISTARRFRRSDWREKYGIRATPTFQFFPERPPAWPRASRASARSRGPRDICCPAAFPDVFKFVSERAYEKGSLRDYLRTTSGT